MSIFSYVEVAVHKFVSLNFIHQLSNLQPNNCTKKGLTKDLKTGTFSFLKHRFSVCQYDKCLFISPCNPCSFDIRVIMG